MTHRPTTTASSTEHGVRIMVSGDVPGPRLRQVLRDARVAATRVRQVWGGSVLARTVHIEVAADGADFRRRGGSAEPGAQIAATTTADGRVVLAPSLFAEVTAAGRVVVLTHELTHVALHRTGAVDIAQWVVEGAAEFTAYRPTRLGLARLAPQLVAAVRAGRAPTGPPNDARFESSPKLAYQEAYAWCSFLVDRFGLTKFKEFVRSADAGSKDGFVTEFGATADSLASPFAAFLQARAGAISTTADAAG